MTTDQRYTSLGSGVSIKLDLTHDSMDLNPPRQATGNSPLSQNTSPAILGTDQVQHKAPPVTLPPPPNGGTVAWVQCGGTFCLWFAAWGLVNSFGVYQAYYETEALPKSSSSSISWIGSLQLCIFLAGTIIIGPIYDTGYLRSLLIGGTVLTVVGMMTTSLCTAYWQFILAQGVCMGIGMTCLFVPLVAVLPPYFSTKRSLAMGLAASGSSIGAIVFSIMFQELQPKIGFGWATRCIGFVLLSSLAFPIVAMAKRVAQSPRRALIDKSALRELPFVLTLAAMFPVFAGLYIPYFYIEVFSVRMNVMRPESGYLNKYLIIFMNAGSLLGRLLPSILADKVGPLNTIVAVAFVTGAIGLSWIAISTQAGVITFGVLYGFFSGSFVALTPVIWAALSPNPSVMGTRTGMMTIPMAAGLLIGNPIAGALVRGQSFLGLQIFCGLTVVCSACFLLAVKLAQLRAGAALKG